MKLIKPMWPIVKKQTVVGEIAGEPVVIHQHFREPSRRGMGLKSTVVYAKLVGPDIPMEFANLVAELLMAGEVLEVFDILEHYLGEAPLELPQLHYDGGPLVYVRDLSSPPVIHHKTAPIIQGDLPTIPGMQVED